MTTLVTGANGLVGAHVVAALLTAGHDVRAFTRPTADPGALASLPVDHREGDVLDLDAVRAAAAGCELIVHTAVPFAYAGQADDDPGRVATEGTTNVLHAARATGVRRLVVTSSSVVLGYRTRPEVIDESAGLASPLGQPGYVAAKIRQDAATLSRAEELGLEAVLACPTMAVGAGGTRLGPSNAIVVQYLADPLRSTLPGGINVVAVEDVALGHVLLAEAGRAGQRYLLGGQNLTWRQVHDLVADLTGVAPPRWTATHTAAFLGAAAEELRARLERRPPLATRDQATMVGRYYWYAHDRAAALGYAPMPARDALARAVAWLATSRHVTREQRTAMHLHPDVFAARRAVAGHGPTAEVDA